MDTRIIFFIFVYLFIAIISIRLLKKRKFDKVKEKTYILGAIHIIKNHVMKSINFYSLI